jgi:hypothetical protein
MVSSVNNLYRGINAHLHSLLQQKGGWQGFHARHTVHIADTLAARVRPLGYRVTLEESLQIRRLAEVHDYRSDLLVFAPGDRSTGTAIAAAPEGTLTIGTLMGEALSDKPYSAIAIRKRDSTHDEQPIAWIELLSPTNKGTSSDANAYRAKRMNLLSAGLVVVEIDYLNETPPTFETIPPYAPDKDGNWNSTARPYRILVLDPRPELIAGPAWNMEFSVDEIIPTVTIPLSGDDRVQVDFNITYDQTFTTGFYGDQIDYSVEPLGFERYAPWDQLRILGRMVALIERSQRQHSAELSSSIEPIDAPLDILREMLTTLRST